MQVILPTASYNPWPANIEPDPRDLLVPDPSEFMRMWPIPGHFTRNFSPGAISGGPGRRLPGKEADGVVVVLAEDQIGFMKNEGRERGDCHLRRSLRSIPAVNLARVRIVAEARCGSQDQRETRPSKCREEWPSCDGLS
jgi:hypothetical protein